MYIPFLSNLCSAYTLHTSGVWCSSKKFQQRIAHVYTHTSCIHYAHVHTHVYTVDMYIDIYLRICTYIYTYMKIHIHTVALVRRPFTYTYVHTHIHTWNTHTYISIHAHIHTVALICRPVIMLSFEGFGNHWHVREFDSTITERKRISELYTTHWRVEVIVLIEVLVHPQDLE